MEFVIQYFLFQFKKTELVVSVFKLDVGNAVEQVNCSCIE
jgi:hypothetical protein